MTTDQPTSQQLLDAVWQNLRQKDIRQAINNSNLLGQQFPGFAAGWHAASHVAQLIRQPKPALIAIDRALKLEPANTDWQLHRVSCLMMCGDNQSATDTLSTLVAGSKRFLNTQLTQLAFLCSRLERHDDAASIYQGLIEREPKNGGHWYNLASIQRFQGQIDQAEASLDQAIALNPQDYEAYELRSDLRKQTAQSNHIQQLQALLKRGIKTPAGEVQIRYALAKELEDSGDPEQSFQALARAATLRRRHINYSISDDLQTMTAIRETFDPALMASVQTDHPRNEPIFVIGLPRTGSTLVERILGSHSEVFAAGELNNFAVQLMQQVRQQTGAQALSRQSLVQHTARLDFSALGKAYIESSRPRTGHTAHFVDKMPLNFLYAGLIHMALPGAKIVHVTREPMDTCYAIYKRLFKDAYPWSYDLDEIASYYLAYRALMQHWHEVMPGVVHEISYENLVTDVDKETRKLIAYCDLEWQAGCLNFDKNMAVSTTASATQVRQPIYTSSVKRWQQYQRQLTPLAEKLGKAGIDIAS